MLDDGSCAVPGVRAEPDGSGETVDVAWGVEAGVNSDDEDCGLNWCGRIGGSEGMIERGGDGSVRKNVSGESKGDEVVGNVDDCDCDDEICNEYV